MTATPLDRLLRDLRAWLAGAKDCKPGGAAGNVCNGVACDFLSEHGDALLSLLAAERDRAEKAEKERDEARTWAERTVADVVAARVVTCVYCGHEYASGTPAAQDAALAEHIKVCDKHPLRQAESRTRTVGCAEA
jgi:hypothetical protein